MSSDGASEAKRSTARMMRETGVRLGDAPENWPKPARQGGRWPGRQRIAVRHLAEDGRTEKAFTHWVRDPKEFAAALGHRLS